MMNSASWASYQAAAELPDRDDDDVPSGPIGPPTWFAVEWFAPVTFRDVDSGAMITMNAPVSRFFAKDRHGNPARAADRWAHAMVQRHGSVTLTLG